jgi:multiple sugar transport system substrate-binding protein
MFTKLKVAPPSTWRMTGCSCAACSWPARSRTTRDADRDRTFEKDAPNLDYGIALMPHPTGRQTSALLGGWSFVVASDGKNKTEAHKLIAFLATPERIGLYTRTFPALKSAMNLPRFADPRLTAFKEMLNHARPQPAIDSWLEIQKIYYRHVQEILIGGATAQDAMEAATKEINGVLKK